jgi:hypothetical protein
VVAVVAITVTVTVTVAVTITVAITVTVTVAVTRAFATEVSGRRGAGEENGEGDRVRGKRPHVGPCAFAGESVRWSM